MFATMALSIAVSFSPTADFNAPALAGIKTLCIQDPRDAIVPGMPLEMVERLLPKQETRIGYGGPPQSQWLDFKYFVESRVFVDLDGHDRVRYVLRRYKDKR
jgi:hypothetical protein